MKSLSIILSGFAVGVAAWPVAVDYVDSSIDERATPGAIAVSKQETNCGPAPCPIFNAKEQYTSTKGSNAWAPPGPADIRGPCPGLNAAANHAYLPRNGVMNIGQTTDGLLAAYNFDPPFAAVLAAFSIIMVGDVTTQTWSIGGPPPFNNIGGLLYPPQGISYSHNKYEGDVSIARYDAYQNHGDAHSLSIKRFNRAFAVGRSDDRYTLHKFRLAFLENLQHSINTNPYYFSPAFAGAVVPPAAYNFVINFMSNHSAKEPNGYLNGAMFKQFFSITGKYPNFTWHPGRERIPDDWYKRPAYNQYDAQKTVADDAIGWAAFPNGFRLGGNTNGTNTYKGVDIASLTGGSYTNGNILKGNNAGCLAFQSQEQAIPDFTKGTINSATAALALFQQFISPVYDQLGCKPLKAYDATVFNQFPGYKYSPTAPNSN